MKIETHMKIHTKMETHGPGFTKWSSVSAHCSFGYGFPRVCLFLPLVHKSSTLLKGWKQQQLTITTMDDGRWRNISSNLPTADRTRPTTELEKCCSELLCYDDGAGSNPDDRPT
ncbi:hypothetical protein CIPAW_05G041400 [Carya illinoinensis]|uniref:Uncharacterized protein n=1 Tax=Carya illinoinensis TaxID=32201 RepID=A0A8T1QEZ5_CARIL|nr:hypothetical protein CIPAW_05G041400 [Carya illinoinensis]